MDFSANRLPSAKRETEWLWKKYVQEQFNLSDININGNSIDFTVPSDYFELSDREADKISLVGRKYGFSSQPVSMDDVELSILGSVGPDTQIGVLLGAIKHKRPKADVYGLFARYKFIGQSVYCSITVCFVDGDIGNEMDTAVFEISEDEAAYVSPVAISEEALDYYSIDDLAKTAYWLGNFWVGVQYELNNCPEEIRIIEQRGPITPQLEEEIKREKRVVLIKRVLPVDKDGNAIKYSATNSGRQYSVPAWRVRGHPRKLKSGKVTYVNPYPKGKERNNPEALVKKEYRFVEEKIDSDTQK